MTWKITARQSKRGLGYITLYRRGRPLLRAHVPNNAPETMNRVVKALANELPFNDLTRWPIKSRVAAVMDLYMAFNGSVMQFKQWQAVLRQQIHHSPMLPKALVAPHRG